jgi:hypothetical protein
LCNDEELGHVDYAGEETGLIGVKQVSLGQIYTSFWTVVITLV